MAATVSANQTYTPAETAAILGMSRRTLADWRCQGDGPPYVKTSPGRTGRVVYLGRDLLEFLQARRVTRPSEAA